MSIWKQPTPTDLVERFSGDKFAATIYMVLLNRCANKAGGVIVSGAFIPLKRGQCIVGRNELGEYFGLTPNSATKVYRKLVRMKNLHKQIDIQRSRNCSIVTLFNYDSDTQFAQTDEVAVHTQLHKPVSILMHTNKIPDKRESKKISSKSLIPNNPSGESVQPLNTLKPLSNHEIWKVAVDLRLDPSVVKSKLEDVLDPANVEKYNITDVKTTLRKWLRNDIKTGQETLDANGMLVLKAQEDIWKK